MLSVTTDMIHMAVEQIRLKGGAGALTYLSHGDRH
jgi:hypothetical protein